MDEIQNEKTINLLVDNILDWWNEHKYDVCHNEGEEYNLYDEEPSFVKIAKNIKLLNKQ